MLVNEARVQWFMDNWPGAFATPSVIREAHRKLAERDAQEVTDGADAMQEP